MIKSVGSSQQDWDRRYLAAERALLDAERVLRVRRALSTGKRSGASWMVAPPTAKTVASSPRVAMYAGSFNPQTAAHALVARAARESLGIVTFVWVLSRNIIDKEHVDRATLGDRTVQLEAYLRHGTAESLMVLDSGLYVDHATSMRALLPASSLLWLVVGFDKVMQIFDRHYYDDRNDTLRRLFGEARLLVIPRAGHTRADLTALLKRRENREFAGAIDFLRTSSAIAAVSSSRARDAAANEQFGDDRSVPSSYLTPEGAALTRVTGAYSGPRRLSTGEFIDEYDVRQRLLKSLARLPQRERKALTLAQLIRVSTAVSRKGDIMRRWLAGDQWLGRPTNIWELAQRVL